MSEVLAFTGEVELRSRSGKALPEITGYAAVFDQRSQDLGGFTERVRPEAFNKTVKESDVLALREHDLGLLLGRKSAGTLALSIDTRGLDYRIRPADTQVARDMIADIEAGNVRGSSFGFRTIKDSWSKEERSVTRDLIEVALRDVGPTVNPAYLTSTSGVAQRSLSGFLGVSEDVVTNALETRSLPELFGGTELRTEPFTPDAMPDGLTYKDMASWVLRNASITLPNGCVVPMAGYESRSYRIRGVVVDLSADELVFRHLMEGKGRHVRTCGNDKCAAPAHIVGGV